MRSSIIRHTADIFDPDLFIVDKEPLGLRGEVRRHLELLQRARHAADPRPARRDGRSRGARDRVGAQERGAGARRILRRALGLRPAADLRPAGRASPCRRACASAWSIPAICGVSAAEPAADRPTCRELVDGEFLLVTPGGGGDGDALVDWVLAAYEHDPGIPLPALIVFGPFMAARARRPSLPPAPRGCRKSTPSPSTRSSKR